MRLAVDAVLAQRTRLVRAGSRANIGGALLVHLLIAGACFVAPLLAAQSVDAVPEFVPVYVVPAQALGVSDPAPRPARPTPPRPETQVATPPEPEPEPNTEERTPEPEPVMRSPEPQRRRPAPAPAATSGEASGEIGRRQGSPSGSSTGTSAFGGARVSFADQNFTYGYYIDQMLSMIHTQWARPALGAEVEAAVFFRIRRDGQISDLRVVESSGFNVFDLAGLRAVRQAAPFPRLPVSYPQSSLAVKLILR